MKRLWLLLFPLLLWGQTPWMNYEEALSKARAENKRVMVMAESPDCPYCHTMTESVLIDPAVSQRIEAHFIPVRMQRNDPALPARVSMTPTFLFVDPHTRAVVKKIPGAWSVKDFCDLIDAAKKEP